MPTIFIATYTTWGDIDAFWCDHDQHDQHDQYCMMIGPNGQPCATVESAMAWIDARHAQELEWLEDDKPEVLERLTPDPMTLDDDTGGEHCRYAVNWREPFSNGEPQPFAYARIYEVEVK